MDGLFLFLNNMENKPIGVFDSGIGGTSILKEIVKLLPNENFIYLADSANAPYGEKEANVIIDLCKKNVDLWLAKGCKLIVVACNTATTIAIETLRSEYNVPFVAIEPAIKPAVLNTSTNTIGILATKGTLNSSLFSKKVDVYNRQNIKIIEVVGKGLVDCLEKGDFNSIYLKDLVYSYIKPMLEQDIDYLVLGCSHYPYLLPIINELVPNHVKVIDSGEAVARQTKNILIKNTLISRNRSKGALIIKTNGNRAIICRIWRNLFKDFTVL